MVHPGQTIRIMFIGPRREGLDVDLTIEDSPYGPIFFPECTDFVDQQRALARQYQFETMQAQLQSVLNESPVH